MSTLNLRAAIGTGSALPKGKQGWVLAEMWCDGLILPRLRFALRVMDTDSGEGGSGRTVGPASHSTWAPGEEPAMGKEPKTLKKSHSAVQLGSPPPPPPLLPRPPPPRTVIARDDHGRAGPSTSLQRQAPPPRVETANAHANANVDAHLKPYRLRKEFSSGRPGTPEPRAVAG